MSKLLHKHIAQNCFKFSFDLILEPSHFDNHLPTPRYLLKQAKWSVNGGDADKAAVRDAPLNKDVEIKRALPDVRKNPMVEVLDTDKEEVMVYETNSLLCISFHDYL